MGAVSKGLEECTNLLFIGVEHNMSLGGFHQGEGREVLCNIVEDTMTSQNIFYSPLLFFFVSPSSVLILGSSDVPKNSM